MPAAEALARIGAQPLTLGAKEGLALLNGTQVSTALALLGLFRAQAVFDAALVAGAMSVDAALGSDVPFDPRLNAVRGQAGADPGRGAAARAARRQPDPRLAPGRVRARPGPLQPALPARR